MRSICLSLIVLSLGVARAGAQESSPDPELIADELQVLREQLLEFARRYESATGEERLVIDAQVGPKAARARNLLVLLGDAIPRAEQEGRDMSGPRAVAADVIATGWRMTERDIEATAARLAAIRTERSAQPPDQRLLIDRELTAADAEMDVHMYWILELASLEDQLGFDATEDLRYVDETLVSRADGLQAQLTVTMNRLAEVDSRMGSATSEELSALRREERANRERLHGTTSSLAAMIDLMQERALDVARYQQLLIRATGDVSTDILDRRVFLGLVEEGWNSARLWFSARAPQFVFNLLVFAVIVLVFKVLAGIVGRIVGTGMSAADQRVPQLLKNMGVSLASKAVLILGVLIGLSQLGIEVGPLLAGLGVAGFIVGFALQDSLSNFAAGLMILFYRPFDEGDVIEAGGVSGKVSHMSLVSTTVLTFDNQKLIVPNSKIWGGVIRNKTAETTRRVDLQFAVGDTEETVRVEALLADIVASHPLVLDKPEPMIKVHSLGESSYDVIVRPWAKTEDYWTVYWDLTRTVKDRFLAEGISKPHPKHDVHVVERQPEGHGVPT